MGAAIISETGPWYAAALSSAGVDTVTPKRRRIAEEVNVDLPSLTAAAVLSDSEEETKKIDPTECAAHFGFLANRNSGVTHIVSMDTCAL